MAFKIFWTKRLLLFISLSAVAWAQAGDHRNPAIIAESKAIEFLTREVPAWSRNNGCFSCHNNGDAARALYAATLKGYKVPPDALADTTRWVAHPSRWEDNKGDPGFSDKRLANVQFAASLLAAFEAGHIKDLRPLEVAARKLASDQGDDGAWNIDAGSTLGSPATYGAQLATYMALRTLKKARLSETADAVRRAERWLIQSSPKNVFAASALLLALSGDTTETARLKQEECLKIILAAQTGDGGWGPYADSPPEPFDTALALIALNEMRMKPGIAERIQRGRTFLAAQQNSDGSWPATTRPPGGISYAQLMSTTGWAARALLETRE